MKTSQTEFDRYKVEAISAVIWVSVAAVVALFVMSTNKPLACEMPSQPPKKTVVV